MTNKARTLAAPMLVAASFIVAPRAEAATIRISDGFTSVDVQATSPGSGLVVSAAIGGWTYFLVGTTKPLEGSATDPSMTLTVTAARSAPCSPTCTLTVMFSEQGFGPGGSSLLATSTSLSFGGLTTYRTYQGATNQLFDLAGGPITTGIGSSTQTGSLPFLGSPYSLTQRIAITNTGPGFTAVTAQATVPDGGSTLAMLGTILLGVGVFRRRLARSL